MKYFITGGAGFIGTNLISELLSRGDGVLNYDLVSPHLEAHRSHWEEGSIMQPAKLEEAMTRYQPDIVIHLAARTECDENTTVEEGYGMNTEGTSHLLAAIKKTKSVQHAIITSSQYVCGPVRQPEDDEDYFPHTVYGWSKVETEKRTRAADLSCRWTIIRPVNIWGPYHARYGKEFWKIAKAGLYVHPNVPAPKRTYGYIGNVVWQILGILEQSPALVDRKVFNVGDQAISIDRWSLGFFREFRGKDPIKMPFVLLKGMACVGDVLSKFQGKPFFINSSRLRSMTTDYITPIDKTESLLGKAPYSLEAGIKETADWYKSQ